MIFKRKMEEYVGLCTSFRLKLVTENTVRIVGKHMRVKFDLFILVEFCIPSIHYRKTVRSQMQDVRTSIRVTNYPLKSF